MKILIETVNHVQQRYPSVGDYFMDIDGTLRIKVSKMNDDRYEFLVAIHELIEEFLTRNRGITEEEITAFDLYYEKRREMGLVPEDSEPGFDSSAPYRKEHTTATGIEMILASELGVDWKEYDRVVNSL